MRLRAMVVTTLLASLAAACAGSATPQPPATVMEPTSTPPPTLAPAPSATASSPAFTPATYTDDFAGFSLDYPADWTLDQTNAVVKSQRGYAVQLTSWAHAPGEIAAQTPAGGSRMDITIYRWDPKNDLDAFVSTRKGAWEASGFTITSEDTWTLAGDHRAIRFLIQSPDEKAFFMLTTVGEMYLVLSGTGDLALLDVIGRTTRVMGAP